MALRGIKVALVKQSSEVMNTLDDDMAVMVSRILENEGVALHRYERLEAFERARAGWQPASR